MDRLQKFETARDQLLACVAAKRPECAAANDRMVRVNNDNNLRLKQFGRRSEWLDYDVVGYDGAAAAAGLLLNADIPLKKEMLSYVEAAYRGGKTSGYYYAVLRDDILCTEHKPQLYGTVLGHDGTACPITDPSNVDRRRAEVGMPPLGRAP